jgi:hypothetical protein
VDRRTKSKRAEIIRRALTKALAPFGFRRTKSTFWTRDHEHVAEFIHLHLFSFAPAFRVHLGVRVLNDSFDAAALNGLSSNDGWYGKRKEYVFTFDEGSESVAECSAFLARFCREVAEPWFAKFPAPDVLLRSTNSPLTGREKERLRLAMSGRGDIQSVRLSRSILGLA